MLAFLLVLLYIIFVVTLVICVVKNCFVDKISRKNTEKQENPENE